MKFSELCERFDQDEKKLLDALVSLRFLLRSKVHNAGTVSEVEKMTLDLERFDKTLAACFGVMV